MDEFPERPPSPPAYPAPPPGLEQARPKVQQQPDRVDPRGSARAGAAGAQRPEEDLSTIPREYAAEPTLRPGLLFTNPSQENEEGVLASNAQNCQRFPSTPTPANLASPANVPVSSQDASASMPDVAEGHGASSARFTFGTISCVGGR